jgi:tetrahydromethanopterin S-methyltransferase subunit G
MPWKSNSPDPIEHRRRQLAEMEKRLEEQRRKLTEGLQGSSAAKQAKAAEPPVWRLEESDGPLERSADPTPARRRHLARQRQRDMILFFICIGLLLIVVVIVLLVYAHNSGPAPSA